MKNEIHTVLIYEFTSIHFCDSCLGWKSK